MRQILGLDLGTNSIGWAITTTEDNKNFQLENKGVLVFPEGVKIEKGQESSKAAERTQYRSARRLKFRRKLRKIETLKVLIKHNLCPPLREEELKNWKLNKKYPENEEFREWTLTKEDPQTNPYKYRAEAVETKFNLDKKEDRYKLGRAIYHIAQRRGFLSNRLEQKDESEGEIKKEIKQITEDKGSLTLGQYFHQRYKKGEKIRTFHTSREDHYLEEFNKICEKQQLSEKLKQELKQAIFYQRPLKSQKGLVGKCVFEKKKPRCPVSHPEFEFFRMFAFLNNIRIKTPEDEHLRPLSDDEKDSIAPLFFRKSKEHFEFNDIARKITPKGNKYGYIRDKDSKNIDYLFNYNLKTTVSGCPFEANMRNIIGDNWRDFLKNNYVNAKNKSIQEIEQDIWHVLFSFDSTEKLKEFAKTKMMLDDKQAENFSKFHLKQGYSELSLKAIRKINPWLKKGLGYTEAVFLANIDEVIPNEKWRITRTQEDVQHKIASIIDKHKIEKDITNIVNSLIKGYREEYNTWNDNEFLVNEYKKDIEKKLAGFFGETKWSSFSQNRKEELRDDVFQKFKTQMQKNLNKGEFIKPKKLEVKIKDFLEDEFNPGKEALEKLYHPSLISIFESPKKLNGKKYLASPRIPSIKNPMAMRTMFQLRYLINELIKKEYIDENTQINVETARDLNNANSRKALQNWQRDRETLRKKYAEEIKKLYKEETGKDIEPTREDILKYQLWEEQNKKCIYTGKSIGIADFIGANPKFDIEHTIPRSLSYDNSQENVTLCELEYNRKTKGNKIPSELPNHNEILQRIEHWKEQADKLHGQIEKLKKRSQSIDEKDQKDRVIQRRHRLEFERDYLRNKYERFIMKDVPEGFKNSQLVDTRLISKYTLQYLKTIFNRVYTVKGSTVADFRVNWGIQQEFEKKERINHVHHCIDAITIACMTRDHYDELARYYHQIEDYELAKSSKKPGFDKPWPTFTQDIKNIDNEILVAHYYPDNITKQTKKIFRKRGKIQRNKKGKPVYMQGDTARGRLHQETFYGAIQRPDITEECQQDKPTDYVVRKPVENLEKNDIKNIVDPVVRSKIQEAINEQGLTEAKKNTIWMNKEKNIPIKKVRCYTPNVKNPLKIKEHRDLSGKEYKQYYYAVNEANYLMAIYKRNTGKKEKREFELITFYDAADYYKQSNRYQSMQHPIFPEEKDGASLYQVIKRSQMVLLYENNPDEVYDSTPGELNKRLYYIVGLSSLKPQNKAYGTIELRHHQEAQPTSDTKLQMGPFKKNNPVYPRRRLYHTQFNALLENIDFTINHLGEITFI